MSGFVTRTLSRNEAILELSRRMGFPWAVAVRQKVPLGDALGLAVGDDVIALDPSPPYDRSLRDGFAVRSSDLVGAGEASPVFLTVCGEVPMGRIPDLKVEREEAVLVHTGGAIPAGADSVVMLEDTSLVGDLLEVRRSVQKGENLLLEGEEYGRGHRLIRKGDILDHRNIAAVASCGAVAVTVCDLRVAIMSTGDEIVPADSQHIVAGMIRDTNSSIIMANMARAGIKGVSLGVVGDDPEKLRATFNDALESFDVLVMSGGSSVSTRDHSLMLLRELGGGDVPVRGLNISPGKPTIVSGDPSRKKMAVCLPGHPHSCAVVSSTFLVPLISSLIMGEPIDRFRKVFLPAEEDVIGRSGVEEFIPVRIGPKGEAMPLWARSGYLLAMSGSDGLIRLPENMETLRRGASVEVWLW
ncbi:MAG TPA: molybdopterin molybdenumtransferase MoeA [Synergistaceae bacterium]|nr:molybdopterin molybdenumtransferase MoeA [Synergistaceae bacterium]